MQKKYLRIKNLDDITYKDRNPIWIKLHCAILDDYEFAQISDETKFHAIGLMLLASRLNNKLPDDEVWLRQKINANSEINLTVLLEIGFLEAVKSPRNRNKSDLSEVKDELSNTLADDKNSFNACKPLEIQGKSVSQKKKPNALEQNRTEEKRREKNTTQHNTTDAPETERENAAVAVGVFSENSFQSNSSGNLSLIKDSLPKVEIKNKSSGQNESGSGFSLEECLKYVEICKTNGEEIKSTKALANHLFKTGESDAFILQTLYPKQQEEIDRETFGEPRQFSDEPCTVCFGAKMADPDGKGFRPCTNCLNERGKPTGWEPL